MIGIRIERPFREEDYHEILIRKFGVPLSRAKEYYNEHREELAGIKDILYSRKEEDLKKRSVLIHIMAHRKSVAMLDNFYHKYSHVRDLYGTQEIMRSTISGLVEQYKLPLISALIYDKNFFDEAKEWYREIDAYSDDDDEEKTEEEEPEKIPIGRYRQAASGLDTGFEEFDDPIKYKDGVLHILGNTKNTIRFNFAFKNYPFREDGSPAETAPYSIRFFFTTTKGSKEPEGNGLLEKGNILANNPRHKELVIQSEPIENIAYTKGIFILGRKNE
jgi:hypothetical protein